jgi:GNAT superfamily N-acetyltransferase
MAVGPIDGNTWNRYRFITDRGTEPLFFLEPDNPDEWPRHFVEMGFEPLAHYFSAVAEDLSLVDDRVARVEKRLDRAGIAIRPFRVDRFDAELEKIYDVSIASFKDNFLYTPIPLDEFAQQYRPIKSFIKPELVLLAERNGMPVGFIFDVPDYAEAQRGNAIDAIIVKTVAVIPGREFAGLGVVLVARAHRLAKDLGYRRVIHALMHESNVSLNISGHYARPFRRYTLYSRKVII